MFRFKNKDKNFYCQTIKYLYIFIQKFDSKFLKINFS